MVTTKVFRLKSKWAWTVRDAGELVYNGYEDTQLKAREAAAKAKQHYAKSTSKR